MADAVIPIVFAEVAASAASPLIVTALLAHASPPHRSRPHEWALPRIAIGMCQCERRDQNPPRPPLIKGGWVDLRVMCG
jgi:hypothetical protein